MCPEGRRDQEVSLEVKDGERVCLCGGAGREKGGGSVGEGTRQ